MADYELINILDEFHKKELEIERFYIIKKEELEKDYKNQKENNRTKLLNSLFTKEEELKNKVEGLQNHLEGLKRDLEGINQIRNILSENEDKKEIQEFKDMLNKSQVNIVHNDIHLGEGNDIQIQENNGMKQSEKEKSEEKEPKKMNLRRKIKIIKWQKGKEKDLIHIIIIKLFALFEIILLLILKINKY